MLEFKKKKLIYKKTTPFLKIIIECRIHNVGKFILPGFATKRSLLTC